MKLFSKTITYNEKELEAELASVENLIRGQRELIADLRAVLAEALEWIERPIKDADDVPLFEDFEERAKRLLPNDPS